MQCHQLMQHHGMRCMWYRDARCEMHIRWRWSVEAEKLPFSRPTDEGRRRTVVGRWMRLKKHYACFRNIVGLEGSTIGHKESLCVSLYVRCGTWTLIHSKYASTVGTTKCSDGACTRYCSMDKVWRPEL